MARMATTKKVLAVVTLISITGCSTKQLEERITFLEQRNQMLVADLQGARNNLEVMRDAKKQWDTALLAARREADDLRRELANVPVVEQAAPGWTAVPGGAMIAIEGNVLFAPGKVSLRKDARRTLDAIASTVNGEYADKDILVFGHTDNTPIRKSGWTDNWQLSSERALAVVRDLSSRGVSKARLVACGCGEHRPRAGNETKADRAKNRRVEIFAIDPQAQTGRP
ncbi:MAG: flagellar motor protein MotB [Phycisphaerae bacterium]